MLPKTAPTLPRLGCAVLEVQGAAYAAPRAPQFQQAVQAAKPSREVVFAGSTLRYIDQASRAQPPRVTVAHTADVGPNNVQELPRVASGVRFAFCAGTVALL